MPLDPAGKKNRSTKNLWEQAVSLISAVLSKSGYEIDAGLMYSGTYCLYFYTSKHVKSRSLMVKIDKNVFKRR